MAHRVTREQQFEMGLVEPSSTPRNFIDAGQWEAVDDAAMPLPAQQTQVIPIQTQAITLDTDSRSFRSIQGTYDDHTKALLRKFISVVVLEALALAGLALLAYIQAWAGAGVLSGGWVVLTAIAGLLSFLALDAQEQKHTPVGSERHRVNRAADVAESTHKTTVDAWRQVNLHSIDRYYDYLEQRDRERNHRKRLPGA